MKLKALALTILFVTIACGHSDKKSESKPAAEQVKTADANLTQERAQQRSLTVAGVAYNLEIALNAEEFSGQVTSKFQLLKPTPQLTFDFRNGNVRKVSVNGKDVAINYQDHQITIPGENLTVGENLVTISFIQKYSTNGTGLYKFVDPADKQTYLYTQFEPYDANHMFPSFDQPDLKAKLTLKVTAPKSWTVISTTRESKIQTAGQNRIWSFPETPALSPYVFSLHAGPYKSWTSNAGNIPLRLFVRRSLAQYVKPQEWFKPTQQGFKFFQSYFDYPYPFKKYDQVIVPDFNFGAMENVAAVTFSERYVKRGDSTRHDRRSLASVILHEMAHMWFGDLVTMRWWNGLWLNESFATYMSDLAMAEATEFNEVWLDFFAGTKGWAYFEDQAVTTHPIEGVVPDTRSAFTNFDGITYGKGASVMKQLAFFAGAEKFRDGLRKYFKDHQYRNTEISDFVGAIAKESKIDLKDWSHLWLERAGLDTLTANFTCENDRVKTFELQMKPPAGETRYRPHRTVVGIFDVKGKETVLRKAVNVKYEQAATPVAELIGEKCPQFVYPNYGDHDYVKVEVDAQSLKHVQTQLGGISDRLTRIMVWDSLYQMVRDSKLPVQAYTSLVQEHFSNERDPSIVEKVMNSIHGWGRTGRNSLLYYYPSEQTHEKKARAEVVKAIETLFWKRVSSAAPNSDEQKNWLDGYTKIAESSEAQGRLINLLSGKLKLAGFKLDQDRRWEMIYRLNALGAAGSAELLSKEKSKDTSEQGIKQAISSEVVQPNIEVKKKWLNTITSNPKDMSFARQRAVMRDFFGVNQDGLAKSIAPIYYGTLMGQVASRDQEFISNFTEDMVPTYCSVESANMLQGFISKNKSALPPAALRPLMVEHQEDVRCISIQGLARQNANVVSH